MRLPRFIALPMLLAAAPALATGGFDCRTSDGSDIALSGTVGHTLASPLVAARLRLGSRSLDTAGEAPTIAIGRSWIDERQIKVDLVDANAMRFEARLRARIGASGTASGTLTRDGATHPVRCTIE